MTEHKIPEKKVELHVHLDGAVRPETFWDIMQYRGMTNIASSLSELCNQVTISEPQGNQVKVLAKFNYFMPIIKANAEACRRIAYEFVKDSAKQGIVYSEVMYAPHVLASDDPKERFNAEQVVLNINRGLDEGQRDFGVMVRSILCCMKRKPEWSAEVLDLCTRYRDSGVVGIGIAGDERFQTDYPHVDAFKKAKERGIHRTVHATESGTVRSLKQAIEEFCAERLGQGLHVVEDQGIYQAIKDQNIHLEICPHYARYLSSKPDIALDCVQKFIDDNVSFSIGTDTPQLYKITLSDEYQYCMNKLGMTRTQLVKTIFDAANACFLPEKEKNQLINDLRTHYRAEHLSTT